MVCAFIWWVFPAHLPLCPPLVGAPGADGSDFGLVRVLL